MRDFDERLEAAFYKIFDAYLDLERNTSRRYEEREYTLERMAPLAALAGNPQDPLKIVHVAGTKGKGSTCMYLAALIVAAGATCGTFTSPHLATVRERFMVNGRLVDYPTLLKEAEWLEQRVRDRGMKPTFFELMTVLGLRLFAQAGVDFAIMETGIGGLLDSTNFLTRPVCTIITPVSFDHTQLLGNTIREIASQKAGIIKARVPVLCTPQPFPETVTVIRETAARLQAPVVEVDPATDVSPWLTGPIAPFSADNFRAALQACAMLGLAPVPARFHAPVLRARCECVQHSPLVILDAAHNADSARRLAEALPVLFPGKRFTVVLGVVAGKDVDGVFRALRPIAEEMILTNPRTLKGTELPRLIELSEAAGVAHSVVPTITRRDDLPADQDLLFTGSFFTALIGESLFSQEATNESAYA